MIMKIIMWAIGIAVATMLGIFLALVATNPNRKSLYEDIPSAELQDYLRLKG
jgi:hypothetical protein